MRQVILKAPIYEHVLESYEAETYVKGPYARSPTEPSYCDTPISSSR